MEFQTYRDLALATLDEAMNCLRGVVPTGEASFEFSLSDLSSIDAAKAVVDCVRGAFTKPACVIYCFELLDDAGYQSLRDKFQKRTEYCDRTGEKLKYSRLSGEPSPSALYVGSSKSFPSRFSQHLGLTGGHGTYSMRLDLWASEEPLDVKLSLWFFSPTMDSWTLELLEQALWDSKRPLLGKRSGR